MKLLVLLSVFLLAGCDSLYGVTHVSYFQPYPSSECILSVTRSIDGVSDVTYSIDKGSRPLTLHGIEQANTNYRYNYQYKGIKNNFFFQEAYDGKVMFYHSYTFLNAYPPQENINTIYPFIINLEKALEAQCHIQGLLSHTKEYCNGIKCPRV